jgi:hypothetical protein
LLKHAPWQSWQQLHSTSMLQPMRALLATHNNLWVFWVSYGIATCFRDDMVFRRAGCEKGPPDKHGDTCIF